DGELRRSRQLLVCRGAGVRRRCPRHEAVSAVAAGDLGGRQGSYEGVDAGERLPVAQGFGGVLLQEVDAPLHLVAHPLSTWLRSGPKFEVLDSIVRPNAIEVVHILSRQKRPAQMF